MQWIHKLPHKVPLLSFCLTIAILLPVHLKVVPPMLMLERFFPGTGWIEIFLLALYAAWLGNRMEKPSRVEKWRRISWLVFSIVFFIQLLLGILWDQRFLMTGKLHLPVPAMIIAGPVYRLKLSFMTLLFLSTVLLTGPAWCSQFCYFGAFDNWAATRSKLRNNPINHKFRIKHTLFVAFVLAVIIFRLTGMNRLAATLAGGLFGIIGIIIMIFFSRKSNKMIHCILYCPVGTLTHYLKYLSPFRMVINKSCTTCMACHLKCKYDALTLSDIRNGKPGITCTYCGECIAACHQQSIIYQFPGLNAVAARNLYLVMTLSLHASFIGLGRI